MQAKLFTLCLALCAVCFSATSQDVPDYVPTDGLMAWYPFNGNANDESGNGNDGAVNGAVLTSDRFGNDGSAYDFDGNNDWINCGSDPSISISSALTYSAWFSAESLTNYAGIVGRGKGTSCNQAVSMIMLDTSNGMRFELKGGTLAPENAQCESVISVPNGFSLNTWNHVVSVWYGPQLDMSAIYLNGQFFASAVTTIESITSGTGSSENFLKIGNRDLYNSGVSYGFFDGKIDDVGVWNRALSDCEITELYEAELSTTNLNAGNDLEICSGDSAVLTATGGTGGLDWTGGVEDGVAFVPDSTMSYVVTGGVGSCTAADTVTVTVLDPVFSLDVQTACDSLTWLDGITYLESTVVPSLVLQSSAGCDSIVSLDLTVNYTTYSTIDTMAVNVFEYEGVEYTEGGEFTIVLDNAAGCDSVVTLKLDLEYVGLEESLAAKSWSLYPNPVTNQLSIDLSKWEGAFSVLLTNALGQVVWEQSVQGIASIDVSAYARGVYTVEVLGLKTRERQTLILR